MITISNIIITKLLINFIINTEDVLTISSFIIAYDIEWRKVIYYCVPYIDPECLIASFLDGEADFYLDINYLIGLGD